MQSTSLPWRLEQLEFELTGSSTIESQITKLGSRSTLVPQFLSDSRSDCNEMTASNRIVALVHNVRLACSREKATCTFLTAALSDIADTNHFIDIFKRVAIISEQANYAVHGYFFESMG
mmetsp:Transcript_24935/g.60223  ORF Transcript_24935/g.60223 Transcript_24935/m.60223 type:complete len:119 (+) Transcript_24935:45-401(+)